MNQLSLDSQIVSGAIGLGRGNVISSKDIAEKPGDYPIYSSSAQGKGEFGRYADYMFDEELITWSVDGGGRFFYRPKHRFSVTNVCGYMRTKDEFWDRRFVYYSLDFQHAKLAFDYQMKAHPSVIRHIYTLNDFTRLEQTKIAEILSTVDRAIEQTEALIAKQQRLKTGLMQDLLTRGIDAHGNLRSESTHTFKDSPLGRIPVEWEVRKLSDVTSKLITYGIVQPGAHVSEGIPFIQTKNLKGTYLDTSNMDRTSNEIHTAYTRSAVCADDIVMGIRASVGVVAKVPLTLDGTNISRGVARLSPSDTILGGYLFWVVQSERIQDSIRLEIKGSTYPEITLPALRNIVVPIPSTLEQKQIGNTLDMSASQIEKSDRQLAKLRALKTALMQDLLTGRKRVTSLLPSDDR